MLLLSFAIYFSRENSVRVTNLGFIVANCDIYERQYLSFPDKRPLTSVASWVL